MAVPVCGLHRPQGHLATAQLPGLLLQLLLLPPPQRRAVLLPLTLLLFLLCIYLPGLLWAVQLRSSEGRWARWGLPAAKRPTGQGGGRNRASLSMACRPDLYSITFSSVARATGQQQQAGFGCSWEWGEARMPPCRPHKDASARKRVYY